MNLYEGTRRILIIALVFWSPVPLYMAWDQWPPFESILGLPDSETVRVGGDYLSKHPLTADQSAEYLRRAGPFLRDNRDYYSEDVPPSQAEIERMAYHLAARDAVWAHWDLRLEVWFRNRESVWKDLALFLALPIAAAFVFYKIGVPILAWILAGFKIPPSSKPES